RNPVLGAMPLSLGDRRALLAIRDVLEKLPDGDIEEVTKPLQYRGIKPRNRAIPIGVCRFGVKLALFHERIRCPDASPLGDITDEDLYHQHILPFPEASQNAALIRLRTMPNTRFLRSIIYSIANNQILGEVRRFFLTCIRSSANMRCPKVESGRGL